MNMKQYSNLHYADSDHLKKQKEEELTPANEEEEKLLKERFEKGEISEAEYRTLSSLGKKVNQDELEFFEPEQEQSAEESSQTFGQQYAKDDSY